MAHLRFPYLLIDPLNKSIPKVQPNGDVIQSAPGFEDHHPELIDGINMSHTIRDLNPNGMNLGMGTRSVSHTKLPVNLVVKPAQTEQVNPDFAAMAIARGQSHFLHNNMTTAHREGLYHKLASKFFGLGDYVPATTVFYHNNHPHSAQVYLPRSKSLLQHTKSVQGQFPEAVANDDYEPIYDTVAPQSDRHKLAIMNTILGNHDRHHGNVLVQQGKMRLIDHGLAFDYAEQPWTDRPLAYIDNSGKELHPDAAAWLSQLDDKLLYNHMISSRVPDGIAKTAQEKLKDMKGLLNHKQSRQQSASLKEVMDAAAGHGIDDELGYKEFYFNIRKPWRP